MANEKVMLIEMSAENEDDSSKQYGADIYLPKGFLFLDEIQTAKFKAALCYEGITTFEDMDEIEYILKNVDSYNLKYFNVYPSDFAKDYLEQHLDDAFPKEYLDLVNTNALGDRLMEELDGAYTPYGILLKSSNEQIFGNESKHEFMLADFLSQHEYLEQSGGMNICQ